MQLFLIFWTALVVFVFTLGVFIPLVDCYKDVVGPKRWQLTKSITYAILIAMTVSLYVIIIGTSQ